MAHRTPTPLACGFLALALCGIGAARAADTSPAPP
jgi:hypothetical protein